jgi:hypothetical protein
MNFKWLTVPKTNETKEVEAVYLYEVRWRSRTGEYGSDTRPEVEGFVTQELADAFATSLRNAYKLLRTTSGTDVSVVTKKFNGTS